MSVPRIDGKLEIPRGFSLRPCQLEHFGDPSFSSSPRREAPTALGSIFRPDSAVAAFPPPNGRAPAGCDNRPFTHSRAAAARCSRPASCTESAPRPLFDAVSVPASMTSAGRTISHQRMTEVAETYSPLKESRKGASTDQVQFVSIGTANKNPAQRQSSFALTMSLAHELSSSGFCDRSSF